MMLLITAFITLTGCQQTVEDSPPPAKKQLPSAGEGLIISSSFETEDFIYRLSSNGGVYEHDEEIIIEAELEYIGSQPQIEISHAASPFYFPMIETTRNYEITYAMNEPLIHTTLIKGVPLKERFIGGGGYSEEDDEDFIQFMKEFMSGDFPDGTYTVQGMTQFKIVDTDEPVQLNTAIQFVVE